MRSSTDPLSVTGGKAKNLMFLDGNAGCLANSPAVFDVEARRRHSVEGHGRRRSTKHRLTR